MSWLREDTHVCVCVFSDPEILQQELNARFLQDRVLANSFCQPPATYLRPPELHQHMHQHQHQHTHQHMCTFPPLAGGLAPPAPTPLLVSTHTYYLFLITEKALMFYVWL